MESTLDHSADVAYQDDAQPLDEIPAYSYTSEEMRERGRDLTAFVSEQMQEGQDYGVIPGFGNKPTLLKPGAEKLNIRYGLAPRLTILDRNVDLANNFVSYEIKVELVNKKNQRLVAEGIGSCCNLERKYKKSEAADVANTILKMAKKRALIDATLSATGTSSIFTQDIEDMDSDQQQRQPQRQQRPPQQPRQATPNYAVRGAQNASEPHDNANLLTDAQHRAILALAGRVYGRHSREEDLARTVNKPIDQLTKAEASSLIDQLRGMIGEAPPQNDYNPNGARRG